LIFIFNHKQCQAGVTVSTWQSLLCQQEVTGSWQKQKSFKVLVYPPASLTF